MAMPQILHISTVHGPLDGRIYYKEARSLHHAGYPVALAGTLAKREVHGGITILPLGTREGSRWTRISRDLRAMVLMMANPNSILHIHDPELLLAALLPALFGRRLVYDVHEFYIERIADSDWIPRYLRTAVSRAYDWIERQALRRFSGVVIVSEQMRERYESILDPDRVALVRNFPFITGGELQSARNAPHPLGDIPYILHTGGASRLRAFHTMVAAAEHLRMRGCTWPILNVGPIDLSGYGADAGALAERAARADVRNLGLVSQESAWSYVAHASIGYMPLIDVENNLRGMPNKLFENLLFGLPMVANARTLAGSIIGAANAGLLVPFEDSAAHAAALERLMTDSKLRNGLAANAAAASHEYVFSGELIQLAALYDRIDQAPRSS